MILYTMMPHEYIFPEDDETFSKQKMIECEAGKLIVEHISPTQIKVVRLLSGNAGDYLNKNYTPGTIIQVKPQF